MTRFGIGMLLVVLVVSWMGCERTEPPAKRGAATQPAATTAPTAREGTALEELKRKAGAAATQAVSAAQEAREQYQRDAERELAKLDAYVADLKSKAAKSAEDARPAIEQQIKEWSEKAQASRAKLEKLKNAGGEAWQELRRGVDAALGEFRQALSGSETSTQPATQPSTQPAVPGGTR